MYAIFREGIQVTKEKAIVDDVQTEALSMNIAFYAGSEVVLKSAYEIKEVEGKNVKKDT